MCFVFLLITKISKENYFLFKNENEIENWLKEADEIGEFAIDTETNSLDAHQANLVGISLCYKPGYSGYIPLAHKFGKNLDELKILKILKPYLEDKSIKKIGQNIKFDLSTKVEKISKGSEGVIVDISNNGKKSILEADVVLISVGRKPYTDNLNLDKIGVSLDKKGRIKVDKNFETNIKNIYAIGDVIDGPMLAHKAEEEGIAVAELIAGQSGHVNYNLIPGVIYTSPEVAYVGENEEQLKEKNINYKIGKFPFMANSRAKAINQAEGFVKILADSSTDRVLGVHIIGPHAGEMIAEMSVAMEFGASSEDIARTCHAHPTFSEAIKEAALSVDKRQIHS